MAKKKVALIAGLIAGFAALWGVAAFTYLNRTTPEELLYAALAEETSEEGYSYEETLGNDNFRIQGTSYVSANDDLRVEGKLVCEGSSDASGDTNLELTMRQIDGEMFMRFDKLTSANTGDPAYDEELNTFFNGLTNKWVIMETKDPDYIAFKEDGVSFHTLGAWSRDLSQKQIADMLMDEKVITTRSSKDTTYKGREAVEYQLRVHRSNYDKFMDRVFADFRNKKETLEQIFEDEDKIDVKLIVDKEHKSASYLEYTATNPCADFLEIVDSDAAAEAPKHLRIGGTDESEKLNKNIKNLEKPTDALTFLQFTNLLYSEDSPLSQETYDDGSYEEEVPDEEPVRSI